MAGQQSQASSLLDTLTDLEDYTPTVPDEVTEHILKLNGTGLQDPRLVQLVSLAAQSFLANVTNDALQVHKRRKQASAWKQKELGYNTKDQRLVLTSEDLAEALQEYGVKLTQPSYFANGFSK